MSQLSIILVAIAVIITNVGSWEQRQQIEELQTQVEEIQLEMRDE